MILYRDADTLEANAAALVSFDPVYKLQVDEAQELAPAVAILKLKSLYHDCLLETVRAFASRMVESQRTDVYYGLLVDFLRRAEQFMTTEEAAAEFASIRRLYAKTNQQMTTNVYSTRETPDYLLAYRNAYYKT